MSELAYFAADTLQTPLYSVEGMLKGKEIRKVPIGPFEIDIEIEYLSDLMTGTEVTLWMTVANSLRFYVISRKRETWIAVLDTHLLKTVGESTGFQAGSIKTRWEELKPAIKAVFKWQDGTEKSAKWIQTPINQIRW